MTKRRITAHKGGRTAIVPSGRIRPQTLAAIHATMRERDKSFADLIEDQYGGNMKVTFTDKQYKESAKCDDGLDALAAVGIDWQQVDEPFENVQQRIFEAHRDGHNTVTFKSK